MDKKDYSFKHALNHSMLSNLNYYVAHVDDTFVVINTHISIWKYTDGALKFIFNIMHNYEAPYCYYRGGKMFVRSKKIKLHDIVNSNYVEIIRNHDIEKLRYVKVIDLDMPDEIINWWEITTKGVEVYERLEALSEYGYDVIDYKFDILDSINKTCLLHETIRLTDEVNQFYESEMKTGISDIFNFNLHKNNLEGDINHVQN